MIKKELSNYIQNYIIKIIVKYINSEKSRLDDNQFKDYNKFKNKIEKLIESIALVCWRWFENVSKNLNVSIDYDCLKNNNDNNNNKEKYLIIKPNNINILKISREKFSFIQGNSNFFIPPKRKYLIELEQFLKELNDNIKLLKNLNQILIDNNDFGININNEYKSFEKSLLYLLIKRIKRYKILNKNSSNCNEEIKIEIKIGLSLLTPLMIIKPLLNDLIIVNGGGDSIINENDLKSINFIEKISNKNLDNSVSDSFKSNELKVILTNISKINSIEVYNINELSLKSMSNYYKSINNINIIDQVYEIIKIQQLLKAIPNLKKFEFSFCYTMFYYYFSNGNSNFLCNCTETNNDSLNEFNENWNFIKNYIINSNCLIELSIQSQCDINGKNGDFLNPSFLLKNDHYFINSFISILNLNNSIKNLKISILDNNQNNNIILSILNNNNNNNNNIKKINNLKIN
ncbi:hypothetical protein DDB_G0291920 [Dictyostelium discoideum AX4]|uniref:Uncharacterized protein n=1 Tax=Dictyostelium discoideum TaxID=44689 RepID=Q54DX9_DICDI|nr:hypothetical protein DDB_G0291920 [Dictyostelium discoideum AX4]EAL61490.1 hypothetical protein DDB_G0291920 [Dictyostelium discoideum AX4]|eukprot:XP_629917.1 hypothetical protein DDB_G0291920 [Dictyostelium discoideum AX4]